MKDLHELLHSLNRTESLFVDKYLRHIPGRAETRSKCLHLLKLVLKNKAEAPKAEYCSQMIMGRQDPAKFQRLKRLVRNHVQDALLSHTVVNETEELSETNRALIRIRKKAALFTWLQYSKHSMPLANKLLNEVIAEAEANEYYYMLIEHLRLRKWMKGLREGSDLFHAANKEIEHYLNCSRALDKAVDSFNTVVMMENEQAKPDAAALNHFLEKAIAETSVDAQTTRSAGVTWYLNWLRVCYCNLNGRHKEGKQICLELLQLLKDRPFLHRPGRLNFVNGNLANCEIHLGNYSAAAQYAILSQKTERVELNLFVLKEKEFEAYYFGGEIGKAQKALKELKGFSQGKLGAGRYAKCRYYEACIHFVQKDSKKARDLLLQHTDLSIDKPGWEMGMRLLLVMCFINLRKPDQAIRALDNLKKFIERCRKEGIHVRRRDEAIVYVLQRLEKSGFNFVTLDEKGKKKLETLCLGKGDLAWTHYSSELVKFHEWALSKMPKRKLAN